MKGFYEKEPNNSDNNGKNQQDCMGWKSFCLALETNRRVKLQTETWEKTIDDYISYEQPQKLNAKKTKAINKQAHEQNKQFSKQIRIDYKYFK